MGRERGKCDKSARTRCGSFSAPQTRSCNWGGVVLLRGRGKGREREGAGGWMGIGRKKGIRMGRERGGDCLVLAMGLGVCNVSDLRLLEAHSPTEVKRDTSLTPHV